MMTVISDVQLYFRKYGKIKISLKENKNRLK
jgi:hypothetical protein